MHALIKNLQLVILREELEIHYCDMQQGNPGNQYFLPENIVNLTHKSFKKDNLIVSS